MLARDGAIELLNQRRQPGIRSACAKASPQTHRGYRCELPAFNGGIQHLFQRLGAIVGGTDDRRTNEVAGQRTPSSNNRQEGGNRPRAETHRQAPDYIPRPQCRMEIGWVRLRPRQLDRRAGRTEPLENVNQCVKGMRQNVDRLYAQRAGTRSRRSPPVCQCAGGFGLEHAALLRTRAEASPARHTQKFTPSPRLFL